MLPGYPALFLWCLLSGIVVPLPEDIPQAWAGMHIASGEMAWAPVLLTAWTGVFLRDAVFYTVGRLLGDRAFVHPVVTRIIPASKLLAARERVAGRGGVAVLFARFSIGVRSATFFTVGAMGVRRRDFIFYDLAGILLSVPVIVGLGYFFGQPVVDAMTWVTRRSPLVFALLLAIGVIAFWSWNRRRARFRQQEE